MNRYLRTFALVTFGLVGAFATGKAQAQDPYCYYPTLSYYTAPAAVPYAGASYSFYTPGYSASYAPAYTAYYAPAYTSYTYVRPLFARARYYNPGPYYYTPAYSYTPGYYSYYYTPGWYRY